MCCHVVAQPRDGAEPDKHGGTVTGAGSARVLVVGEALIDIVPAEHGLDVRPGGSPFNVAIGLARLGLRPTLATQIGDDENGARLRRMLIDEGVRLLDLAPRPAQSSYALATLDDHRDARYEFRVKWDPRSLPDPSDYDLVHIGSISTYLEPGASVLSSWAETVEATGTLLSYDPNVRASLVTEPASLPQRFSRLADLSTCVKLSLEDASLVRPGAPASDLLLELARTSGFAALTRGADSALLASGERLVEIALPTRRVTDTIGAGDSFMAALIYASLAHGVFGLGEVPAHHLHRIGVFAARAAAITCSRVGADPPRLTELS